MQKFLDTNKQEIDSVFSLETISSYQGLVLESWGPSTRNPEYAKAFETLLKRLQEFGLPTIRVFVVSSRLTKVFPSIVDREIFLNKNNPISLVNREVEEIRINIGQKVAELKESPNNNKGGNRYKRILIYSSLVSSLTWSKLATGNISTENNVIKDLVPIFDYELLDQQVEAIEPYINEVPEGQNKPKRHPKNANIIERDPLVKAWVLQKANGICELCDSKAPFIKSNGKPYLEVHHVKRLANNGADKISNAIAVCPNCHRALHYSSNCDELTEKLYQRVSRLVRQCN